MKFDAPSVLQGIIADHTALVTMGHTAISRLQGICIKCSTVNIGLSIASPAQCARNACTACQAAFVPIFVTPLGARFGAYCMAVAAETSGVIKTSCEVHCLMTLVLCQSELCKPIVLCLCCHTALGHKPQIANIAS